MVTTFFGFARNNGTIGYIAKTVIYWVRNVPWLLPIVYFLLNFGMAAIGVSLPAINMFLLPIFIELVYDTKTTGLYLTLGANQGGSAGCLSPAGATGMICLKGVMNKAGLSTLIGNAVSGGIGNWLLPVVLALLCSVLSMFADSMSVVLPLMVPIAGALSGSTGLSLVKLVSCVVIGALSSGFSPFSTGGAVFLGFVKQERTQKIMLQSLLGVFINAIAIALMALVGIIR